MTVVVQWLLGLHVPTHLRTGRDFLEALFAYAQLVLANETEPVRLVRMLVLPKPNHGGRPSNLLLPALLPLLCHSHRRTAPTGPLVHKPCMPSRTLPWLPST
jgi:hypothetical protein